MDGQIIVSTVAASLALCGKEVNGSLDCSEIADIVFDNVVLLTNDNGLAIRARERGIYAQRYGYKYSEPYTGRRNITVTKEVFEEFYNERRLERIDFERMMPDEPKLITNEFIVMSLERESDYPRDFDPTNNPCKLGYVCENNVCVEIGKKDMEQTLIILCIKMRIYRKL